MKRTGMRLTAVAAVTALLLGGCGEQPYSLTEDEEGMIVDYSAHAVAKFNTSQPDGLANVSRNEQETEAVDESQTTETENKSHWMHPAMQLQETRAQRIKQQSRRHWMNCLEEKICRSHIPEQKLQQIIWRAVIIRWMQSRARHL